MKNRTGELSGRIEEQSAAEESLEEESAEEEQSPFDIPVAGLRREAIEQITRERVIEREDDLILAQKEPPITESVGQKKDSAFYKRAVRANFRMLIDFGKSKKTSRLLIKFGKAITRSSLMYSRRLPFF